MTPLHQPNRQRQRGAALLLAMLVVTLVATLASAAVWQQWQHVAVEQAERDRQQASWILTGSLDWARLILREDARTNQNTGSGDHLAEPWAVGLEEAKLASFLAADKQTDPPPALEAFLSGSIQDQQGLLNVANLVHQGKLSEPDVRAFSRLFDHLGLQQAELNTLASQWLLASQPTQSSPPAGSAEPAQPTAARPLKPHRTSQLGWLGLSHTSLMRLQPYITVLPERTPVNLNTAPVEVVLASIPSLDMARARRLASQRSLQPFKTLADITPLLDGATLDSTQHATQSRYFLVKGRLRLTEHVVEEHSLVQRNGLDVKTLWRERVQPSTPDKAANGTDRNPHTPARKP
ncbi:MAG TPA: type II secretion system minor pseudopilin GspK [Burkholderiaceae bacterium]|nr:type II secretion system minor pseudopilin GspK [Burkholderiaceae bacterium]